MLPVVPFEQLVSNITTNTITVPLNTTSLNLKAIFLLIPVKNIKLQDSETLKVKSGKIIYPKYFNEPGMIISARYMTEVRGFVRSEKNAFPTSITMDIGTSVRILSIKFSQTIEITGADGFDNAKEAVEYVLTQLRDVQEKHELLKADHELTKQARESLWEPHPDPEVEKLRQILQFFIQDRGEPEACEAFLDQFLLRFDGNLYEGELVACQYLSEMINLAFDLGVPVNQREMSKVLDQPPFQTFFSNISSSMKIRVVIPYLKMRKGEEKIGFDYIKINRSGYVLMIGHSLETLRKIYYTFYYHVLNNTEKILSPVKYPFRTAVSEKGCIINVEDYLRIKAEQKTLQEDILQRRYPVLECCRLIEMEAH